MSIYDSLNSEQQKAVRQTEGPVLILAGAGSGKTRVITHRIAYLMDEGNVSPWNILAITFTNKAAGEMRERVDKLIGFGAESVWISTFHSLCVRILRRHIDQLGYDCSFTIYDTDDQKSLMKQICSRMKIDPKQMSPRMFLNAISSAKNELIRPQTYKDQHSSSFYYQVIGEVYEEYQKELFKNNALDFDDLLMKTVELFQGFPEILQSYQQRFRYIMVDEYQDTNTAQFEIIRQLAAAHHNLCVVGDDDQSIYKFRGANIRNILDFEKVYPEAMVIRLEQNYRSTQNVLDAANAVIHHNTERKDKKLWTDRGRGSLIHYRLFNTGFEEASWIAEDIDSRMRKDHKLRYSDFSVLYRMNSQARAIEEQLVMHSIPYNVVGGTNFYDRMEIRDIISYLKTIDNARDDLAVQRIINVPRRGIGRTTIDRISVYAITHDMAFFDALEQADQIPEIARAKGKITPFVELIHDLRSFAQTNTLENTIREIVDRTQYEEYLRDVDEVSADDRMDNINELISKAVTFEENAQAEEDRDTGLDGFLEEIALIADIDNTDDSDDKVLLMTLHSAKGLEFSHVYMTGMEENTFPSYMSLNADNPDEEVEEERRLCYVGITRAKDDLTLTSARSRLIAGNWQNNPVSRFVLEIPRELLDENPKAASDPFDSQDEDNSDEMPWDSTDSFEKFSGRSSERDVPDTGIFRASSGITKGFPTGNGNVSRKLPAKDRRLKAVYVKPHTQESKKPFIASMAGISKGIPAGAKPDYQVGDRVHHVKHGDGTVREIKKGSKDYIVTVDFDGCGTRKLAASIAKLTKY